MFRNDQQRKLELKLTHLLKSVAALPCDITALQHINSVQNYTKNENVINVTSIANEIRFKSVSLM